MEKGSSGCCKKKVAPEIPIANATGIPAAKSIRNTVITISIFFLHIIWLRERFSTKLLP
jgi:hypothetical protein